MPRPRFERLPIERQRQILDVAARHFAADGFAGASLNRMLDEAGVSKGAAYYYFDDKGDLFATVVEEAWEEARAVLWGDGFDPATLRGEGFWAELERVYTRQVALFEERPHVWRVVKATREALGDPSAARLAPRIQELMATLIGALEQAQRDGLVRDDLPRDLILAMVGGLDDAIDSWWIDHADALQADPELPARAFAAMRRMLQPDDPAAQMLMR